jgi:Ni,Fe-hydrogenase III large subunit
MSAISAAVIRNVEPVPTRSIPLLSNAEFRSMALGEIAGGARISAFWGAPACNAVRLSVLLAHDASGDLAIISTDVEESYPSLTPECPQAHWFEREIAEQWRIIPVGHPWLKPIRFHAPYRNSPKSRDAAETTIGITDFFQVKGAEIHEVAVGPVHAGIIEPGHFRFQCHGENVYHLEISLGYQHRGVERALIEQPEKRRVHLIENIAGDTTIGHATAYSQLVEALSGCRAPARAVSLRGIALELERIANHTGDLGALAGDVGYLPTMSYCGRIRGDFLNMTALLCGNRFGRGLARPGGIAIDSDSDRLAELRKRLDAAYRDVTGAVEIMLNSSSVLARFEGTGVIPIEASRELGLVGPMARACGQKLDARCDFPSGIYRFSQVPVSTWHTGDVFSRALVRWLEIQNSVQFIRDQIDSYPAGDNRNVQGTLPPGMTGISIVEGWRGEICHVASTDENGNLNRYKVVDPSFHNWFGLAFMLRGQQISDFPLCNKSANLSYCGHDL